MSSITIAVVGGSGFLGRHVVSELEQSAAQGQDKWKVKEIRVLDLVPYTSLKDTKENTVYEKCDIRNLSQLTRSLKGADVVINCSVVKPDLSQDEVTCDSEMWKVNVDGVKNLVRACQEVGVSVLIHTSTLAVKVGGVKLMEHTETLTPEVSEKDLLLGDYARSRLRAEEAVLEAHNSSTETGSKLSTVVLRPPLFMYGEGDRDFVPQILRLARAGGGNKIPAIGNRDAFLQAAYAGNVARGHVLALKKLLKEKHEGGLQTIGGLPVYLTDDTPPHNLPGLVSPFLQQFDTEPAPDVSFWTATVLIFLLRFWGALWSLLGASSSSVASFPSWTLHRLGQTITVVSRLRAELSMDYNPPYSWAEALDRSKLYYASALAKGES